MKQKLLFLSILLAAFILTAGTIDLYNLFPYATQAAPNYINKSNSNVATDDALATLGRVLFYDKNLSNNNTIACASCHQQEFAFSDPANQSVGLNGGLTGRHSMRLINTRYANEGRFFWDERANSLEDQTTQPIQDHVEMGFSGTNGDPDINDLLSKLSNINYYDELFSLAFGDANITEQRMQDAMANFIRSIQSFDSKYDEGIAMVVGNNPNAPFPNFTPQENAGKAIFMAPPNLGPNNNGAGCNVCHNAPEFDIDPNSDNNGIIGVAGDPMEIDLTNTRAPTLRDMINPSGTLNGPLMHDGSLQSLAQVINHYANIPDNPVNTNLDPRLNPPGPGAQVLNLSGQDIDNLLAFLATLTGTAVYTAEQWSDPFDPNGYLDMTLVADTEIMLEDCGITILHNPTEENIQIQLLSGDYTVQILDAMDTVYKTLTFCSNRITVDISQLPVGTYFLKIQDNSNGENSIHTILKE